MCGLKYDGDRSPELALVELIAKETGVVFDKHTLALFLRLNWGKVASLAHKIHGSDVEAA